MRNRSVVKTGLGALGGCLILGFSLCAGTWAAGSPSLKVAGQPATPAVAANAKIAIIIDDLGYRRDFGERATRLPGAVTLSILPHSPHAQEVAHLAASRGKELMLHAPMSSILDQPMEPGALTRDMSKSRFLATLNAGLDELPTIRGVNNHMGSELTQHQQPMAWLMEELRGRDLYFVDSRTIAASLAWETALIHGVPAARRDVFLDNDASYPAIAGQFGRLLQIAKAHGQAVAIAHPYPETLAFLEAALPMLAPAGVELVPVSRLLTPPKPNHKVTKNRIDRSRETNRFTKVPIYQKVNSHSSP